MFFSIIVPVYNAQDYIEETILSVLNQSFQDYELILINDGSKDQTAQILNHYAEKDSRVKVKHIENKGVSHARNEGIRLAEGEYILFLDADDSYVKDALKKMHKVCENYQPELLTYGYEEHVIEAGKTLKSLHFANKSTYENLAAIRENLLSIISDEMFGAVWSKIYKRTLIQENHIQMNENLYIGEDYCFNLEVLRHAQKYQTIQEPFYIYKIQNQESIIKRYKKDKFEQMYLMHQIRKAFILEESRCGDLKNQISCRMNFIRLCFSCFMDLSREECPYQLKEKMRFVKEKMIVEKEKFHKNYLKHLSFGQKIVYLIFQSQRVFIIYLFSKICYDIKFKWSNIFRRMKSFKHQ